MDMPLTAIGKLHCWMSIYWGQSFTPEFYKDVNLMWGQFISWLFSSNELSEHGRHLNICHETAIRAWKTFEYLPWNWYQSMEDIWIFAMKLLSEHGRHLNVYHESAIRAWKTFEYLPWNCYQSMEDIWIFAMKLYEVLTCFSQVSLIRPLIIMTHPIYWLSFPREDKQVLC